MRHGQGMGVRWKSRREYAVTQSGLEVLVKGEAWGEVQVWSADIQMVGQVVWKVFFLFWMSLT